MIDLQWEGFAAIGMLLYTFAAMLDCLAQSTFRSCEINAYGL